MFFNEVELVKLRVRELAPYVDRFCVVEADTTHLGMPKPFNFEKALPDLLEFKDKIDYHKVSLVSYNGWGKENEHRNIIPNLLTGVNSEDYVIISDCDEIPNPNIFDEFKYVHTYSVLTQLFFVHYLNLFTSTAQSNSIVYKYDYLKWADSTHAGKAANNIRRQKDLGPFIQNGGWHYSNMGGINTFKEKAEAIAEGRSPCHETSIEVLEKLVADTITNKKSPFSNGRINTPAFIKNQTITFNNLIGNSYVPTTLPVDIYSNELIQNHDRYQHLLFQEEL